MIDYKTLFHSEPFDKKIKKNEKWFLNNQKKLSIYHSENSIFYNKLSKSLFKPLKKIKKIYELPYIHVSAFKNFEIKTNKIKKNIKVFSSSGTSQKNKSRIFLDPKTSILQIKALEKIFQDVIEKKTSIFFLEKKNFFSSKENFSAKGAAIKGFSQLAKKSYFLKDSNNKLNISKLKKYIEKSPKKKFVIFGFTSQIWFDLISTLKKKKIYFQKNCGVLIHGGGWKKLEKLKVKNTEFKKNAKKFLGVKKVLNYYGMIEQTGSVFLECERGFFHCSIFSDILIRNANLNPCELNEVGLIQSLSLLPTSYPGHNILTEDMGKIIGNNDCKCGKGGKYFSIIGRVPNTELRGCSDAT